MRKTTGPTKHGVMGRWSIFRDKTNGTRVQGVLTAEGAIDFEMHREALRLLYRDIMRREPSSVSDADTIEFIARGTMKTARHLRAQARLEQRAI